MNALETAIDSTPVLSDSSITGPIAADLDNRAVILEGLGLPVWAEADEILAAQEHRRVEQIEDLKKNGPFVQGTSDLPKIELITPTDPAIRAAVDEWVESHER